MKNNLFKHKRKRRLITLAIISPLIVLVFLLSLFSFKSLKNIGAFSSGDSETFNIEKYDYHLRPNATDYQKTLFKELDSLLSYYEYTGSEIKDIDVEIANSIVKNYVADMYTWTNKNGSFDVGGVSFMYSKLRANIYRQAQYFFYNNLGIYFRKYGKENLLEVSEVEAKHIGNDTVDFGAEGKLRCIVVEAKWKYVENDKFDSSKYSTSSVFYVTRLNNGRFEIVIEQERL